MSFETVSPELSAAASDGLDEGRVPAPTTAEGRDPQWDGPGSVETAEAARAEVGETQSQRTVAADVAAPPTDVAVQEERSPMEAVPNEDAFDMFDAFAETPEPITPKIVVIGVGGAGGNAVNTMIRQNLVGVDYIAANTDAQALAGSEAPTRLQLGRRTTEGLGAGANPKVGHKAAEESAEAIAAALQGAHMCFVAAGMGGGTGTGAAPVIARVAREQGVLTVGVVTKPFDFEGGRRQAVAEAGVAALKKTVDTLIVIPNQNLFRVATQNTTFSEAFQMADEVLHQGVKGVTDLMLKPGLINLDFADVRAVVDEMGNAMMGAGEASGEDRALDAAQRAIDNPLLDEVTLSGAKGVLINICGGPDLKLYEVDAAANRIRQDADPQATVLFGSTIEPELEGRIRVSVVATGIAEKAKSAASVKPPATTNEEAAALAETAEAVAGPLASPTAAAPSLSGREPGRGEVQESAQSTPDPAPQPGFGGELVRKLAASATAPARVRGFGAATPPTSPTSARAAETSDDSASAAAAASTGDGNRIDIPSFLRRPTS